MRSRRHKLQVSTFPFLAVLLCAMGALLLVLLVMDRRAHNAARQRAEVAARRAADETAREAEERRAALEKARQAVLAVQQQKRDDEHARLERQTAEVQGAVQSVREQVVQAAGRMQAEQEEEAALRKKAEAERARAAAEEQALIQVRGEAVKQADQSEASRKALAQMTADLAQLERTLADLKAAREKGQKTYSVVPYNGKRGENRRPLYIECTSAGVILHPDRMALGEASIASDLQGEVERRLAHQKEQLPPAQAAAFSPYLMLLVRPDGVVTYYTVREALHALSIDFGYEFIDQDWALAFPTDGPAPAWTTAAKPAMETPSTAPSSPALHGLATGPEHGAPLTAGTPSAAPSGPALHGYVAGPEHGSPLTTGAPGNGATYGTGNENLSGSPNANIGGPVGAPPGSPGSGLPPLIGSIAPPRSPVGSGVALGTPSANQGAAGPAVPKMDAVVQGGPPRTSPAVPAPPGPPGLVLTPGTSPGSPPPAPPGGPNVAPGAVSVGPGAANAVSGAVQGNPATGPAAATGPSLGGPTTQAPAGEAPRADAAPWNGKATPPPAPPSADADRDATKAPAGARSPTADNAAAGDGPDADPFLRAPPPPLPVASRVAPALRPARLSGDRDWILYVECKPEGVVIYPTRLLLPASALSRPTGSNPLPQTVQQLIDHKQATVRPGEPPYRPEVRFLVHPDALRTYHMAYPTLDALAAPKTALTLSPDDDVSAIVAGH